MALGFPVLQAVFFGLVLSLSSTAIVLRIYNDRRELETPHGNIALGILLFQDILIVPYLLVVPLLGGSAQASWSSVLWRLGGGVLILSAAFAASRYLIPRLLQYLVATRVREMFLMGALFLCFGAALATQQLGFSLALGAFLAGVLIAESDYHLQVIADIMPFRDLFNSMFFISIGMLLQLDFVVQHPLEVGLATLLILTIKGSALYLSVRGLLFTHRIAAIVALGLSQIGEFSFVLIQTGKACGIVDPWTYQLAIAASIVTMALTPLLIYIAPAIGRRMGSFEGKSPEPPPGEQLRNHVIIVGYGLAGRHLATVLKAASLPYVILELNGATVRRAKRDGEPILYGDASRSDILVRCGILGARIIVFVISDPPSVRRGVKLARQMNPDLFIITRARMQAEIEGLRASGADDVVSEEFETSIEIFTSVLTHLRVPGNIIRSQTKLLRTDDYQVLRSATPMAHLSEDITRALSAGTIDTFLVVPDMKAAGMTIAQLDLRRATGAAILALVRNDEPRTNPGPDVQILAGDVLVVVGSHAQMDSAFRYLEATRAEVEGAVTGAPDA